MASIQTSFYLGKESFLSRLDPRVKLIYILWVFIMIIILTDPVYQMFTMFTLLLAIFAGSLSVWDVIKDGKLGIFAGLASFMLWTIFLRGEGTQVFTILGWVITDYGMLKGVSVALRISSVLFAFLIVAKATPNRDIITGFYGLKVSGVFAMVIGIVLRLIPQFQSEHGNIMEAQKSRATEFEKGGLIARFRKHISYIIPLVLRALKIVSDLSIAMESRAYDPYVKRTFVRELKMETADYVVLFSLIAFLVLSIVLRILGYGGLELGLLGSGQ